MGPTTIRIELRSRYSQVVNLDDEDIPMPSVDHSIVELDDGKPQF